MPDVAGSRATGSVHLAVATLADRLPLIGAPAIARSGLGSRMDEGALPEAEPAARVFYVRSVFIAWGTLAVVSGFLAIALAFVGNALAGDPGNRAGEAIGLALAVFCFVGACYAYWRLVFAYVARSRATRHGTLDGRYRKLARRTTLRNSSLPAQAALGILVFYLIVR